MKTFKAAQVAFFMSIQISYDFLKIIQAAIQSILTSLVLQGVDGSKSDLNNQDVSRYLFSANKKVFAFQQRP